MRRCLQISANNFCRGNRKFSTSSSVWQQRNGFSAGMFGLVLPDPASSSSSSQPFHGWGPVRNFATSEPRNFSTEAAAARKSADSAKSVSTTAGGSSSSSSPKSTIKELKEKYPDKIIDGNAIALKVRQEIKEEVEDLAGSVVPGIAVILVGNRPDSATYVLAKGKAARDCGFNVVDVHLPETATYEEVCEAVIDLNSRDDVHGILVQLPLPDHLPERRILKKISIGKDVDAFSGYNIGNLTLRGAAPLANPCTPAGVMVMLREAGVDINGKKCVILGRSNIVGTPMALLLLHKNGTVTICHSRTEDIKAECQQADILVAALGKPEFVRGDWIKPGAVVIDVGINLKPDPTKKSGKRMCGDVCFEECIENVSKITPVPGGVGPMTIAMLLMNTLNLAKRAAIISEHKYIKSIDDYILTGRE